VPAFGTSREEGVPAHVLRQSDERPALELPVANPEKGERLMKAKSGRIYERFLEIEARKEEILAIWEKTGHTLSATAKQTNLSTSTLLGKLKQWDIKTRGQEESKGKRRGKRRGKAQPRHLKIEARKEEILAIWEKTGHKFLATARQAKVSNSELSRKFKEWGIRTPAQEAKLALLDRQKEVRAGTPDLSKPTQLVTLPAHTPELLITLLQMLPERGSGYIVVARWKNAWDAALSLMYDNDGK
jgi:lambda repressor-like predicted transcriptional regulator